MILKIDRKDKDRFNELTRASEIFHLARSFTMLAYHKSILLSLGLRFTSLRNALLSLSSFSSSSSFSLLLEYPVGEVNERHENTCETEQKRNDKVLRKGK